MNKYNVYIDLDSFTYLVEAKDEETAHLLAVNAMTEYLAKYANDIGIADVVVDEDNGIDDADIDLRENIKSDWDGISEAMQDLAKLVKFKGVI